MQHANDWLKKQLEVEDIAVSIQAQHRLSETASDAAPLLRTRCLRIAALAPVFAVLADRAVVGQTTATVDVDSEPVMCSISSQQVAWLKVFAQAVPTVLAARGMPFGDSIQGSLVVLRPTLHVHWALSAHVIIVGRIFAGKLLHTVLLHALQPV